jgi:hypothetical protein
MSFRSVRVSRSVLLLLCAIPALFATVNAQVAGRNVNMVSGGSFPGGDPYLQKQNEPSLAMSTRNPCHLLAGSNDYRAVNLPGLPGDQEIGDAWLGWYESTDCGATWYSTLVPGYPQDASAAGLASPVKGLSAGADPVVRSGAAGTFYYLFIAFNRGSNVGKLALARAIDHNDRETFVDPNSLPVSLDGTSNPRRALSPIRYVGTTEIAKGSSGQFIDKPNLAVFPAATGTCTIDGETVPATNVYVSWTEFVGNSPENLRSKVYFARSADCGTTLAGPATKLSEGYPLGQGTAIAVNPNNPNDIYVVWRQIRNDRGKDALLYARSTDGGRSFSKAEYIPSFGEGEFLPFDQNTTSKSRGQLTTTFRTIAYPTLAFADDGFLYLAVSQVPAENYTPGSLGGADARITMTRTNGAGWAPAQPVAVTNAPAASGQQIMPALAYAAGKMQLVWYDVRFDEAGLTSDALIDDEKGLGDPSIRRRRTMDLLGAQATIGANGFTFPLQFSAYGVSQPDYNDPPSPVGPPALRGPRLSQYEIGDRTPPTGPLPEQQNADGGARQLQFNRGGLLLYGGGSIPFMGDYIDVAPIPFVLDRATGRWVFNGKANVDKAALQTFQAAWTDNRDANVGKAVSETLPGTPPTTRFKYDVPLALDGAIVSEVSCPVPGVDNTRTRDANVYTSRITQDFSFTAPSNSKHAFSGVIRSFAVQLANNRELNPAGTDAATTYSIKIEAGPRASFSRKSFVIGSDQTCGNALPEVRDLTVKVLPRSSAARTIYVPCGASGPITITATDASTGAKAAVLINADPSNPGVKGPDGGPLGPETHNPDAENPDAENPDAENPDAENPDAENPDAENPDAENPDAENPDAENPDAENPDAENPDAENPDAENPDAENANYQDVTAEVTNSGDTTSGYQVDVEASGDTSGYKFLLMGRRVYSTPTSINCHLVQKNTNQTLFAIPLDGADLGSDGFLEENDPGEKNATFLVRPGEKVRVTLRVVWDSKVTSQPFCQPGTCFDRITIRTKAEAPNTGELEPREAVVGNFPDLTVKGALTVPAFAGIGGFIDMPATTIANIGTRSANADGNISWDYFASTDPVLSANEDDDPSFGVGDSTDSEIDAGQSVPFGPRRLVMPFVRSGAGAKYFIGIIADYDEVVGESDESNNTLVAPTPVEIVPYMVQIDEVFAPEGGGRVATVTVTTIDGDGTRAVESANVQLTLERPMAQNNEPGFVHTEFGSDTTDENGVAQFNLPVSLPGEGPYRFVATVTVGDVAAPLKFQTGCLNCSVIP